MRESQLSSPTKKYIEVQYNPVTQGYLREYCLDNDFDLSTRFDGTDQTAQAFDFHTTVWYTSNSVVMPTYSQDIAINDIVPNGFALFGPDENILVLEIDSAEIRAMRDMLGDKYGLEDEWPDYRPHITLSYAFSGDLPTVDLPDGNYLTATMLNVKTQK
jgi:hypothetical protein